MIIIIIVRGEMTIVIRYDSMVQARIQEYKQNVVSIETEASDASSYRDPGYVYSEMYNYLEKYI